MRSETPDNRFGDPAQDESLWLVFAKGRAEPPFALHMAAAKRPGLWWRKVATEADARDIVARLRTAGFSGWCKYEAEMPERETAKERRQRDRDFRAYQQDIRPAPVSLTIMLDPNRDRSSGRKTYDQYRATDRAPNVWEPKPKT